MSDWYLMRSSMPSLIMETATTKTRGAMAVTGFSGENIEMDWRIAISKK